MKAKDEGIKDPLAAGMNEERIALLEQIGFAWSARPPEESDSWNARYQELIEYRRVHGDCLVPRNYQPNQKLANFVSNQRTHYRLYQKSQLLGNSEESDYTFLTEERVAKLEAIGFAWTLRNKRTDNKKEEPSGSSSATERPAAAEAAAAPAAQPPVPAAQLPHPDTPLADVAAAAREENKVESWEV